MDPGVIGGIAGGVIGGVGGAIGTYFGIVRTKSSAERKMMIRAAVVCWIAVLVFLVLLLWLPSPWRYLLWIPYGIALPLGIRWMNREQQRIRSEEEEAEA